MKSSTGDIIAEAINETKEDVSDILSSVGIETEESIEEVPVIEELPPEPAPRETESVWDKVAIRMTSWWKGRRGWDDLLLSKKELKTIPRKKYKLI